MEEHSVELGGISSPVQDKHGIMDERVVLWVAYPSLWLQG